MLLVPHVLPRQTFRLIHSPTHYMVYTYLVLQFALLLLSIGGYFQVKKFLGLHHSISSERHLNSFKSLVRTNMYIALVYLALGIPTVLLSIYFGFAYGLLGVGAVLAVNIPQLLFGNHLKSLEMKARGLQCSAMLADEYQMVGETWHKKALPNF